MRKIAIYLIIPLFLFGISCSNNDRPAEKSNDGKTTSTDQIETDSKIEQDDKSVETIHLKLKMNKGDAYIMTVRTEEKLTQEMGEQKQTVKQTNSITYNCNIKDVNKNGDFTAKFKFNRIIKEVDGGPQNKQTFDSKIPKKEYESVPQILILQNMIGQTYSVTITPEGKISKVEGSNKLIDNTLKGIQAEEKVKQMLLMAFKQEFGEDKLASFYEKLFNYLDTIPRKLGDTWNKEYSIQSGMSLNVTTEYQLSEITPNRIILKIKSKLRDKSGKQTQKLENVIITFEVTGDQNGIIEIDRNTGFITNSVVNQKIIAIETRVLQDSTKQSVTLKSTKNAKYIIKTQKK